jgi:hypothetical protein
MAKVDKATSRDYPTQLTVGMTGVHEKRKHPAAMRVADPQDFLKAVPLPAAVADRHMERR